MKDWLAGIYRSPKRHAIWQATFWCFLMIVFYSVRDLVTGRGLTGHTAVAIIVSCVIGAVIFGFLTYWLRTRLMKRDGL